MKLYIFVVQIKLFLVVEVVLDTQLRLMGMLVLIRLTRAWLKCLASSTDPK
jgi:hypothetical protein